MGKQHLIDELRFETELDQAASVDLPWSDWSSLCRDRLLAIIDGIFDEFSPPGGAPHRLDSLEVDLGTLPNTLSIDELEKHLGQALRQSLATSLADKTPSNVITASAIPSPLSELAALEFYLQHGLPSWHADSTALYPLQANLLRQAKSCSQHLKNLFLSSPLALERCIRQSSDATLNTLIALLSPGASISVTPWETPADQIETGDSRYRAWQGALQQAFAQDRINATDRQTPSTSSAPTSKKTLAAPLHHSSSESNPNKPSSTAASQPATDSATATQPPSTNKARQSIHCGNDTHLPAEGEKDAPYLRQPTECAPPTSVHPTARQSIQQASTSCSTEVSSVPIHPPPANPTLAASTSAAIAENSCSATAGSSVTTKVAHTTTGQARLVSIPCDTAAIDYSTAAHRISESSLTETSVPPWRPAPSSSGSRLDSAPKTDAAIPARSSTEQSSRAAVPADATPVSSQTRLRHVADTPGINAGRPPIPESAGLDHTTSELARITSVPANMLQEAKPSVWQKIAETRITETADQTRKIVSTIPHPAGNSTPGAETPILVQAPAGQEPAETMRTVNPTTHAVDASIAMASNPTAGTSTSPCHAVTDSTTIPASVLLATSTQPSVSAAALTDRAQSAKPETRPQTAKTALLDIADTASNHASPSEGTARKHTSMPETTVPGPLSAGQARRMDTPAETMRTDNPTTHAVDASIAVASNPTAGIGTSPCHAVTDSTTIPASVLLATSTQPSVSAAALTDRAQSAKPETRPQTAKTALLDIADTASNHASPSEGTARKHTSMPETTVPGPLSAGQARRTDTSAETMRTDNPTTHAVDASIAVASNPTAGIGTSPSPPHADSATMLPPPLAPMSADLSGKTATPEHTQQSASATALRQLTESSLTAISIPDESPTPTLPGNTASGLPMPETTICDHASTEQSQRKVPEEMALGGKPPTSYHATGVGVTGIFILADSPDPATNGAPSPKTPLSGLASADLSQAISASAEATIQSPRPTALHRSAESNFTEIAVQTSNLVESGNTMLSSSPPGSATPLPGRAVAGSDRWTSAPDNAPPASNTGRTETVSPIRSLDSSSAQVNTDPPTVHGTLIASQAPTPSTSANPKRSSSPITAVAHPAAGKLSDSASIASSGELREHIINTPEAPIADHAIPDLTQPTSLSPAPQQAPCMDATGQPDAGNGTARPFQDEVANISPMAPDEAGSPETVAQSVAYWRSRVLARVHGEFAKAIERHAGQAIDQTRYYRRLLTALTADVPIDPAAIAAQSSNPSDDDSSPTIVEATDERNASSDAPEPSIPPSLPAADWIEALLASGNSALRLVVSPLLADQKKLPGLLDIWSDELFERVFAQLRNPDFDRLLPYAEAMSDACPGATVGSKRRLKWQTLADALFPHPRYNATADFVVACAERFAAASPTRENFRAALCANLSGCPERQRVEQYLRYWLLGGSTTLPPSSLAEFNPAAILPSSGLAISNAGQVLAAPYLPRLFKMLGLLDQGRFAGLPLARRACHLLQFMVDPQSAAAEHQLLLNKLLCGLDVRQPLDVGIEISEQEKTLIEALLQGIISNWGALGSTSIAGLREAFLQRPGLLAYRDEAWQLKIEKKTLDILMERLPWSFSIIRHAWMKQAVMVNWR